MAEEKPITPPIRKPVQTFDTPNPADGYFSEMVSRTDPAYAANAPLKRGTSYATITGAKQTVIDQFPQGLYFVSETRVGTSDQLVVWLWSTIKTAQDAYNPEVSYSGEATAYPVYARVYTVLRETYDAAPTVAYGSALTSLIGVKVTSAGAGYASGDVVLAGATAIGEVVADENGGVLSVIVTKDTSGYDSAALPVMTITSSNTIDATLVAIVQPKTAVLVEQKKQEFPEDHPLRNEFVRVIRIYETLPGPYLPFTRYDENLGPIQGRRRAVVNSGQAASVTATVKTTYEARNGSSYVSWEIQETNSNGTGSAGNPAYPILVKDIYDDERGAVQETSQIVVATGSEVGSLATSGTTITRITYLPYADNPALLRKVIETWTKTGPLLHGQTYDEDLSLVVPYTDQLVATGTTLGNDSTTVVPINKEQDKSHAIDLTALDAILDTFVLAFPSTADFNFPPVLTGVTGLIEEHYGDGDYSEDGDAFWLATGSAGASASLSIQGSGQASASVIPKVSPTIREPWDKDRPVMEYMFLLPMPVSAADVLSKLNSLAGGGISAQPKFSPVTDTFFAVGRQTSLTCKASSNWQDGGRGDDSAEEHSESAGTGTSRELGLSMDVLRTPACIHGAISVAGDTTKSRDISCQATATALISADTGVISETVTGHITPTSLSATANTNAIPGSGKFLVRVDGSPWKYRRARFRCVVGDYADVG